MRHTGIVGHSWEGASLCFRVFCERGFSTLGGFQHPDVTLDCIAFGRSMPAWDAGDYDAVRAVLATSVTRLAAAGAEFFVCPDNTAHLALEWPGPPLALPGLHIAEIVADQAAAEGRRRVGVLGTRYTMEGPLYGPAFAARGIETQVPDAVGRDMVNRVIFDELVHGIISEASRAAYVQVIERLAEAGCDAVALVCTEIPLLVSAETSPLPSLDSTVLLAHAALDVATEARELPLWRGGAVRDAVGV